MKQFANNLKVLRESKSLKQYEMAEILKVSNTTYNNYETGVSNPNIFGLMEISIFFDVSETDLLHSTNILEKIGSFKKWFPSEGTTDKNSDYKSEEEDLIDQLLGINKKPKSSGTKEAILEALRNLLLTKNELIESQKKRILLLEEKLNKHS